MVFYRHGHSVHNIGSPAASPFKLRRFGVKKGRLLVTVLDAMPGVALAPVCRAVFS